MRLTIAFTSVLCIKGFLTKGRTTTPPKKSSYHLERAFICRCFCALQRYSVRGSLASYIPDSLIYAFDPQPIHAPSNEALSQQLTTNKALAGLGLYAPTPKTKELIELFSGTVVDSPPDLTPTELVHLGLEVLHHGTPELYESYFIHQLPAPLRLNADRALAATPFALNKMTGDPQIKVFRVPPGVDANIAGRVECIEQCRDKVLSVPTPVTKLIPHTAYAILKRPKDPPNPGFIDAEKPAYGRARIGLPGQTVPEEHKSFFAKMMDRWLGLYSLAARFDPFRGAPSYTTTLDQKVATSLAINESRVCPDLVNLFRDTAVLETTWKDLGKKHKIFKDVDEFLHPEELNPVPLELPPMFTSFLQVGQQGHMLYPQAGLSTGPTTADIVAGFNPNQAPKPNARPLVSNERREAALKAGPNAVSIPRDKGAIIPVVIPDASFPELTQTVQQKMRESVLLASWPTGSSQIMLEQVSPVYRFRGNAIIDSENNPQIGPIFSGMQGARNDSFLHFYISQQEGLAIRSAQQRLMGLSWVSDTINGLYPRLQAAADATPPTVYVNSEGLIIRTDFSKPDPIGLIKEMTFEYHGAMFVACGTFKDQRTLMMTPRSVLVFAVHPVAAELLFRDGTRHQSAMLGPPEIVAMMEKDILTILVQGR